MEAFTSDSVLRTYLKSTYLSLELQDLRIISIDHIIVVVYFIFNTL